MHEYNRTETGFLLLAVVFSGWRRQIQRAASGFVLHGNHNHQCNWRPGHASILHRKPLLWLHLWSLSSRKSSFSCYILIIIILMLIVLLILILINVCTLIMCAYFSIFFLQGSEIITVSAKDGDQGNPNPIVYSILNGKLVKNYAWLLHLCSDGVSPSREWRCVWHKQHQWMYHCDHIPVAAEKGAVWN